MNYRKAFTLIELLVVISIISLLSSVVLASLNSAREKGRMAAALKFATHTYRTLGAEAAVILDFEDYVSGLGNWPTILDSSGNNNHFRNDYVFAEVIDANSIDNPNISSKYAVNCQNPGTTQRKSARC